MMSAVALAQYGGGGGWSSYISYPLGGAPSVTSSNGSSSNGSSSNGSLASSSNGSSSMTNSITTTTPTRTLNLDTVMGNNGMGLWSTAQTTPSREEGMGLVLPDTGIAL